MKDSKNLFKLTPIWENVVTGTKFTGTIREQYCEGRIYVKPDGPGNVFYLCQNLQDGATAPNTLGYRYSYTVGFGTEEELAENEVVFYSLEADPSFVAPVQVTVGDYNVKFFTGYIMVGCTKVTNEEVVNVSENLVWEGTVV